MATLELLRRKRPQNIGGRQLFVKDLIQLASTKGASYGGGALVRGRHLVQRHGKHWREMTADQKLTFEAQAPAAQSEAQRRISDQIDDCTAGLLLLRQRNLVQEAVIPPLLLSAAKLTQAEIDKCDEMFGRPSFRK